MSDKNITVRIGFPVITLIMFFVLINYHNPGVALFAIEVDDIIFALIWIIIIDVSIIIIIIAIVIVIAILAG